MPMENQKSLVSILSVVKNRAYTIRRCVESVLSQDYSNIEFIIQDGASTDGTLEVLQEYAQRHPGRIKIVSEPDSSGGEAFFRALKRCTGDIIGSCLSDEELLPHAVSWAVEQFERHLDAGAVYGDYYSTDLEGNILNEGRPGSFDIKRYLLHEVVPPFLASFFRRSCLEQCGLKTRQWTTDVGEFEIWVRMGLRYPIYYVPGFLAKYGVHPDSATCKPKTYFDMAETRKRLMREIFNEPATPAEIRALEGQAFAGFHLWTASTFVGLNLFDEAKEQIVQSMQYQPRPGRLAFLVFLMIQNQQNLTDIAPQLLDYFDRAFANNPYDEDILYGRAITLMHIRRFKEAKSALQATLHMYPAHNGAITLLSYLKSLSEDKPYPLNNPVIADRPQDVISLKTAESEDSSMERAKIFNNWISKIAIAHRRLYYRDQTPDSLKTLVEIVHHYKTTRVIELGTLSGLSLRTWLSADSQLQVTAIDLSFSGLSESQKILPLDLSRVKLVEQDILTVDFHQLWSPEDRVLIYVDAHDSPGVNIMDHVIHHALPFLPQGSVVVVDDLWYSGTTLSKENALDFFDQVVTTQIDPLLIVDFDFASYWKGGSLVGFPEVIPLLRWINQNRVVLKIPKQIKNVYFQYPLPKGQKFSNVSLDGSNFERQEGKIQYNPVENFKVYDLENPQSRQALMWCQLGAQAYELGKDNETYTCFERALAVHPAISGAYYAQAVCLARYGHFDKAIQTLHREINLPYPPHSKSTTLLKDVQNWLSPPKSAPTVKEQIVSKTDKTATQQVTLFAMPKPFRDHINTIQRNAILSWMNLRPQPEIILFGEEKGVPEICAEFGLRHVPKVSRNEFGTPLVNKILEFGQLFASHDVMSYINADIILLDDFLPAVKKVTQTFESFLMIGRRFDLDVDFEIDFQDPHWQENIRSYALQNGKYHPYTGIDYFLFRRGMWGEIPPFAIGRTAWDNWLVSYPLSKGIPVVNATPSVFIIHQNHDWGHVRGGYQEAWNGVEALRNRELAASLPVGTIADANWKVTPKEVTKNYPILPIFEEGMKYLRIGDPASALDSFDTVLRMASDLPNIHYARAVGLLSLGRHAEALQDLQSELMINPNNPQVVNLREQILFSQRG
jgi:glycosyltransferase involved in cell wall biosynthesis